MSSNNPLPLADTADTPSPTTDKSHPVDTDNAPLTWDGNAACIAGLDHAVGKFYKRTGQFDALFVVTHSESASISRSHRSTSSNLADLVNLSIV